MRSRTIAIAGSIAALSFAAVPVAQAAKSKPHHFATMTSSLDRSRDRAGVRHTDRSIDPRPDTSVDVHDR